MGRWTRLGDWEIGWRNKSRTLTVFNLAGLVGLGVGRDGKSGDNGDGRETHYIDMC